MLHPVSLHPDEEDAKTAVKDFVHWALVIPAVEPDGNPRPSVYQSITHYQPSVSASVSACSRLSVDE